MSVRGKEQRDVQRQGTRIVVKARAEDPLPRVRGLRKKRATGAKLSDRELLEAIADMLLLLLEDRGIGA